MNSMLKHLVPGSVVSEHQRKNCKLELQDCGLRALQEAGKRSRKSWLRLVWKDGRSRFGCSICAKASTETGPWSKFEQDPATVLRKHNLDRHEKSKTHHCLRGMVLAMPNFVLKILRLLDYDVAYAKMNTRYFGIPQSRPRAYLIAVCKECLVQPLVMPEPRSNHPDLHTFLDKEIMGEETLPTYAEQLGPKLWSHGYVLDVAASARCQHALTNCSPCLTKTRCQQHGFYIPKLRRRLSVQEMARLQGLPTTVTAGLLETCDESGSRSVEEAVGDGMSINVLHTVLRRVLDSAGLTRLGASKDFWLQCPPQKCHCLSDNLWNKYA